MPGLVSKGKKKQHRQECLCHGVLDHRCLKVSHDTIKIPMPKTQPITRLLVEWGEGSGALSSN